MAALVHNQAKKWLLDQVAGQTIKAMFMSSLTPDIDAQAFISDVSAGETSGTGYTAGGVTLANVVVTKRDASDDAILDADDITLANSSITAVAVVFYIDTGNAATSPILSSDTFASQTSNAGNFTYTMPAGGILDLG